MVRPSRFAIRDDDTSYFTHPDELDAVYGAYWGKVPISLAVVPFAVPNHCETINFDPSYPSDVEVPLEKNHALVHWLRGKLKAKQVEVMLHGYSHAYQKRGRRWKAELSWKSKARILEEIPKGKAYLEQLLNTEVKVFVPPSNAISKAGIEALKHAGLHLSGILSLRKLDRPLTLTYFLAYIKRWSWRVWYRSPYPFVLRPYYVNELVMHTLSTTMDQSKLSKGFLYRLEQSRRHSAPFVLATHYWKLQRHPVARQVLARLIQQVKVVEMAPSFVSDCFQSV